MEATNQENEIGRNSGTVSKNERGRKAGTPQGVGALNCLQDGSAANVDRPRDVCGHCNKKCQNRGRGSDGLYCDYCCYWVHASCEGMEMDTYKTFSELASVIPNMTYYCNLNHCKTVASEILKQLGPLKQKVTENAHRITVLEEAVHKQKDIIEKAVSDEVANCLNEVIEEKVQKVMDNEKDRSFRAKNVIISDMVESTSSDLQIRKEEDTEKVKSLLERDLEIDLSEVTVKHVLRLGKREDYSRPRLIKVVFDHEDMAVKVLKESRKLRDAREESIRKIKIFNDLSKTDREKRSKLVTEMKARNLEMIAQGVTDKKWILRGERLEKRRANFAAQSKNF